MDISSASIKDVDEMTDPEVASVYMAGDHMKIDDAMALEHFLFRSERVLRAAAAAKRRADQRGSR